MENSYHSLEGKRGKIHIGLKEDIKPLCGSKIEIIEKGPRVRYVGYMLQEFYGHNLLHVKKWIKTDEERYCLMCLNKMNKE